MVSAACRAVVDDDGRLLNIIVIVVPCRAIVLLLYVRFDEFCQAWMDATTRVDMYYDRKRSGNGECTVVWMDGILNSKSNST
jgi:hypothetical protein